MNLFDLTGKVAFVTGASSGVGASAAVAYAKAGADVVVFARRKERLEDVAKEIESYGKKALVLPGDVTNEEEVSESVGKAIDNFGHIDILLNNAGVGSAGAVQQLSQEDWDRTMVVNVKGLFLVSKYILPYMQKQKYGKVVNVSSINATVADNDPLLVRHAYNTSKAAVRGLTIGMAGSYGADNITVNSVSPGMFRSEMTKDSIYRSQGFMERYLEVTPMNRMGQEGELNGTFIFLSSDASSYLTGQHIVVDGGYTII